MCVRRICLIVAYDGTEYHGWQVQNNAVTIEEVLNQCLSDLLQEEIQVSGASRTDAGVHALCNAAIFDTQTRMPADKIAYALNARLPEDIRIQKSMEVAPDWHPRFANSKKTYEYHIYRGEFAMPIGRQYHLFTYRKPDVALMRKAADYFSGEHDFKSFCQSGAQTETTVRTIYGLDIRESGPELVIRVCGNGFLYNMVRIIVGTLLEVGEGKRTPESMKEVIDGKDRSLAGPTAPANGLLLAGYDFENLGKFGRVYEEKND